MLRIGLLLAIVFQQALRFQVTGEISGSARRDLRSAQIESIDRRFVAFGDIEPDGRFSFKNVPEGLCKIIIVTSNGREEQRSIEVRQEFADARGRITVKIELSDAGVSRDKLKVGVHALGVSPKAVEELQRAYEAKGDIEKVRQHLEKAIEISPNFDEALNNLGTIYYHDKEFGKASVLFQRAIQSNPNSFPAQVNLGGALISLGDYDHALSENLKAVAMRPADSLAQSQTGQALSYLKRYDEALSHLQTAKQIDPASFALPGFFIAQIYQLQGEKSRAIDEYKEFLKVHPGHAYTALIEARIRSLE